MYPPHELTIEYTTDTAYNAIHKGLLKSLHTSYRGQCMIMNFDA